MILPILKDKFLAAGWAAMINLASQAEPSQSRNTSHVAVVLGVGCFLLSG
jgi:hypothetical protein